MEARVEIQGRLKGGLKLTQDLPTEPVHIRGKICGFTREDIGKHGFHIHEGNTLPLPGEEWEGPTCCGKGLGGHFNPLGKHHGGRLSQERHAGDLGNIEVNDLCEDCKTWYSTVNIYDRGITLFNGPTNILNRGVVIHEDIDDLGRGKNKESLITGNAGKRIGWGIIRLSK